MLILPFKAAGHFEITDPVEALLRQYRQRPRQNEMGGVLAGWLRSEDGVFVVSHLSLPSHKHKAGKTWFQLNQKVAQAYVDLVFNSSGGMIDFCGFWHTHPEPNPSPSPPDRKVIADLFRNGRLNIKYQLGLIVGTTGQICAWSQDEDGACESILPNF